MHVCCLWLHEALRPRRHAGEVLFGTDSHTCNAGAFGQFATGVGNTDAGFILGTGKLLIKVLTFGVMRAHAYVFCVRCSPL